MSITLDGLELPDELIWTDEFIWSKVTATTKRTIEGKFIVQEGILPSDAGRNITLFSDDAWITRNGVLQLQDMSHVADRQMTLLMNDGVVHLCRFRHWEESVLTAEMLVPTAWPDIATQYKLTLRLSVV